MLINALAVRGARRMVVIAGPVACLGCSPAARDDARRPWVDAGEAEEPTVEVTEIVRGVADRGRDPAVVAIDVEGEGLCSGAVISPRLVLTARHCAAKTVDSVVCPPPGVQVMRDRDPTRLAVLLGDDVASARAGARGIEVVAPAGVTLCEADIAIVVLDRDLPLKPLPVARRGVSVGDRVRAVGFGRSTDRSRRAGVRLVREHVPVRSVMAAEFTVGEATCQGDSGGPALDEDTGEIIGVVSRGGTTCEGRDAHNVYTRADVYAWLVEEAFARVGEIDAKERADGGTAGAPKTPKRGSKQKPPSDIGGPCASADECAAGLCVTDGDRRYCSRPCGPGDRCPARYHCKQTPSKVSACLNVR